MVEQSSQRDKLLLTVAFRIRATIDLLLMHRRVEMSIEGLYGIELIVAQIAFPVGAVEGTVGG